VELEQVYVQGLVHVSSMTDDYYRFNEKAHLLQGENTKKVYRLGDRAKVQLARVDLERRQLDFALVDVLERTAAGARKGRPPASSRRDTPSPPRRPVRRRRR
jgi:ribonuclease R